jgi:hypothetical protein
MGPMVMPAAKAAVTAAAVRKRRGARAGGVPRPAPGPELGAVPVAAFEFASSAIRRVPFRAGRAGAPILGGRVVPAA